MCDGGIEAILDSRWEEKRLRAVWVLGTES